MTRIILKVDVHNEKQKLKVLKAVMLPGIVGSDINMREQKLTVIGEIDPGKVWMKLNSVCRSTIISVEMDFAERERAEEEQRNREQEEKIRGEMGMGMRMPSMNMINYRSKGASYYFNPPYPSRNSYPTLW